MTPEPKDVIGADIIRAQAELVDALSELEKMPSPGAVMYARHALSNYLSVMGLAIELVARRLENHPDLLLRRLVNGVALAVELMTGEVGRLAMGPVSTENALRFEPVDLTESLQRFCDYYQDTASGKLIRLINDSADDVAPVLVDRVAMLSVLDSLISNAIKFSPPDRRVWLGVRSENDTVVCRVRDEGPGLNEEDQARLFQKGARLTPRPTAGEASTGYGLAVAKDLVDKLGGSIRCESVLGQGTTFFIQFPAYRNAAPA
ncbi:MAG TPA: HAMP domain-containing sensor histidine kinase [Nitrospira sp.]